MLKQKNTHEGLSQLTTQLPYLLGRYMATLREQLGLLDGCDRFLGEKCFVVDNGDIFLFGV